MKRGLVVWHDNGVKGQNGYTEYSQEEINKIGGLDSLIKEYQAAGIFIYSLVDITLEE